MDLTGTFIRNHQTISCYLSQLLQMPDNKLKSFFRVKTLEVESYHYVIHLVGNKIRGRDYFGSRKFHG